MTREQKLQLIKEQKDPMLYMQRLLTERAVAEAVGKVHLAVGPMGPEGAPGKDGRSIVGLQGPRGIEGKTGLEGRPGKNGVNGKDGIDGKNGKNGKDATPLALEKIVTSVLEELKGGKKLTIDHIDGLTGSLGQLKEFLKAGGYRGGGDVIAAGGGISVTVNSNGQKVITNTGSSSTIYTETPSGAIDGSNTVYTTVHSITTVLTLAINGQFLHPTTDYTYSGTTVTFVTALPVEAAGTGFTIVYQ